MLSEWVMHYAAHSALTMTAAAAMAWMSERVLRRAGPEMQHRVWVAALAAGVALPLVPAVWLSESSAAGAGAAYGSATITYRMIGAVPGLWVVSPGLGALLASAYLMSVLLALMRVMWRWQRTSAMARRSKAIVPDPRAERLLEEAARLCGVMVPEMRCSTEIPGPAVLGVRRLLLLVPEGFFGGEEEDIAAALAHECTHLARRDFTKNIVYECAAVAVAYHPALWWMRRRIAGTREMVCDERAATNGKRPEYAASLLRLAQAMAATDDGAHQAIGVFDGNTLEERIMRLTTEVPKMSRIRKIAMTAVATGALLAGVLTAAALPFDVMPQKSAAQATQGKVYKVGGDVTAPVLTHSVDAEYSKKAKDAHYQGVSVVSCVVGMDGLPRQVRTTRSLGMGLDEKAIEAVRQYRFEPALLHGRPVAVAIVIEVHFRFY